MEKVQFLKYTFEGPVSLVCIADDFFLAQPNTSSAEALVAQPEMNKRQAVPADAAFDEALMAMAGLSMEDVPSKPEVKKGQDSTDATSDEILTAMAGLSLKEVSLKSEVNSDAAFDAALTALAGFSMKENILPRPVTLVTAKTLLNAAVRFYHSGSLCPDAVLHIIDIIRLHADAPELASYIRGAKRAITSMQGAKKQSSKGKNKSKSHVCPTSKFSRTGCGLHRDSYVFECTAKDVPIGNVLTIGIFKKAARMGLSFLYANLDTAPTIPAALRKIMRRQMHISMNEFLETIECQFIFRKEEGEVNPTLVSETHIRKATDAHIKAILDAAKDWDNDRA